jgi:hypothetical protein
MIKGILSLFIVIIISFSITGCTKKEAITANGNPNNSNSIASKAISNQNNSSSKQSYDAIQDLSNSMDALDKTLNDMDNTKDINDTDSLINNLK